MSNTPICRDHPEREGAWHVHLPSIGVDFWRCVECELVSQGIMSKYKSKREAWELREDHWYVAGKDNEGRTIILEKR